MKCCTKCDREKPESDYARAGYYKGEIIRRADCKTCCNAQRRAWRKDHRDIENQRLRVWRAANLDHYRSYQRQFQRNWVKANPEKSAAIHRRYKRKVVAA
jgi:hypothetical protein